jgi:hypothetical protein
MNTTSPTKFSVVERDNVKRQQWNTHPTVPLYFAADKQGLHANTESRISGAFLLRVFRNTKQEKTSPVLLCASIRRAKHSLRRLIFLFESRMTIAVLKSILWPKLLPLVTRRRHSLPVKYPTQYGASRQSTNSQGRDSCPGSG